MKPLFICNTSQVQLIKAHIESNKLFKGVDLSNCFVTSMGAYEERFNDLSGSGDAPFTRIYIDPYLEWSETGFFGYQIALEILKNWKKKEAPGIVFISLLKQVMLDKLVKGRINSLVREFPHFDILDLDNKIIPFNTFSNNRWKYLRAYALTSSGILDEISHDLTTIILQNESSRSNLERLLERTRTLSETVGKEVIQYIGSYQKDVNVSSFARVLKEKIGDRLKELRPHNPSTIEIPSNMNLMIIEDNEEHLQVLEKSLTERPGYFEKNKTLFSYTNGAEVLAELKKSKNEYQLVLVDLRLNDENGFAQPVHGVDIIEELQTNHPLTSYTIITGMGRKGIGELLNIDVKFILSKKQLYSFDTDSEVDAMLTKMFADVAQREKSVHYNYGPNNGIYSWTMFKTNLFALGREVFKEHQTIAISNLEKFKSKELDQKFPIYAPKNKKQYDLNKLEKYHINMLTQRLIFLWLALKNNNRLVCDSEAQEEYSDILKRCGKLAISDAKASLLGLTQNTVGNEDGIQIIEFDLTDIWPHEKVVVEEWNIEHGKIYLDHLQDIIISEKHPSLYKFIRTHFHYKEEDFKSCNFEVPADLSVWNFKDLGEFLTQVFDDYSDKGENSLHYLKVESMRNDNYSYNYFEQQIAPYLPEVDEKFMDL
ncbi:MAG: hypothetical protein JJE44_02100 [Flavobacteriaceae bacterium]|nr:hypothetical protein [Flavobacteriaceae bacterium]